MKSNFWCCAIYEILTRGCSHTSPEAMPYLVIFLSLSHTRVVCIPNIPLFCAGKNHFVSAILMCPELACKLLYIPHALGTRPFQYRSVSVSISALSLTSLCDVVNSSIVQCFCPGQVSPGSDNIICWASVEFLATNN